NHLSIQMAATRFTVYLVRNHQKKQGFTFIATAHNSDDSVETFFINLSRGCGIDGLTGIKPRSGKVIRPLLFASRDMIVQYAKRKGILYREDSSNQTDKYLRNYIRHNVMPVLDEASPNFRKGIQTTLQNLVSSQAIYNEYLEKIKLELITYTNDTVLVHIPALKQTNHISTILWEILSNYQFNRETCTEISGSLDAQSGKIFLSPTHRLIKDRSQLIITLIPRNETGTYYIESDSVPLGLPVKFEMMAEDFNSMELIEKNRNIAMLDLKKLNGH
ncbi:MAG: tRNA lysidine(34) synthetase TilS, partial [Bacteroidetes bacterium]|nr:tRNA lysidine(34) synthetase TilS [Bacteroidota bacterium]